MFLKNKKVLFFLILLIPIIFIALASVALQPVIVKDRLIFVEVARTPAQRAKGLQGRMYLAENRGMLFVFPQEIYPQFWMKETIIPLSIAFINKQKTIIEIQQMEPLQTRVRYVPGKPSKYALEMNKGWFAKNGISAGDKLLFW
jgi:hypothetical protein